MSVSKMKGHCGFCHEDLPLSSLLRFEYPSGKFKPQLVCATHHSKLTKVWSTLFSQNAKV